MTIRRRFSETGTQERQSNDGAERENNRFRQLAVAVVTAATLLAACGTAPDNATPATGIPGDLIADLAPVGQPNWSAVFPYELPELRPVASAESRIPGYEYPETRPEATETTTDEGRTIGPR